MKTSKSKKRIGASGEKLTALYLFLRGYRILAKNYLVKGGEIDIVAKKFSTLVFVEVKTRDAKHTDTYGRASDAVGLKKREHLRFAAKRYISELSPHFKAVRFDVAEVYNTGKKHKINYIKDAFR